MRAARHWRILLATGFFIPPVFRGAWSVIGVAGNADFIISHTAEPGWVGVVIGWLISPPDWVYLPMIGGGLVLIWWDAKRKRQGQTASSQAPSSNGFQSRFATMKQLTGTGYFIAPERVLTLKVSVYGAGGGGSEGRAKPGEIGAISSFGNHCTTTGGEGGRIDNTHPREGQPYGSDIGRTGGGARGGDCTTDQLGRQGVRGADGGFSSKIIHVTPGEKIYYMVGHGGRGAGNARSGQDGFIIVEY